MFSLTSCIIINLTQNVTFCLVIAAPGAALWQSQKYSTQRTAVKTGLNLLELMQGQAQVPWDLVEMSSPGVSRFRIALTCNLTSQA